MVWDPHSAERIENCITQFIADHGSLLENVSTETRPLRDFAETFLARGKRFRARFCILGWAAIATRHKHDHPPGTTTPNENERIPESVIVAAAALEIFHAAALVHDDIIDNSDLRRGAPSAHRRFESVHTASGYVGSGRDFGLHAALLLGDLLQAWSDELFNVGLEGTDGESRAHAARTEYNTMRTHVTAGQYLDVLEESAWASRDERELLSRAERITEYKSAKYSVEAPLCIGASLGGASNEQRDALRAFGFPLGVAFQLRDDLLGVYGDPTVTGKPSGDDLREGKRTVLIALARERVDPGQRAEIDEMLGSPMLRDRDVEELQTIIRDSGAVTILEQRIRDNVSQALQHLSAHAFGAAAIKELTALTHAVTQRNA